MTNFFTLNPINTKFTSRISTIEKRIQKYGDSSSSDLVKKQNCWLN